jgi:hypothetical protein
VTVLPVLVRAEPGETVMLLTVLVGYESTHCSATGWFVVPEDRLSVKGIDVTEVAVEDERDTDCADAVPISAR